MSDGVAVLDGQGIALPFIAPIDNLPDFLPGYCGKIRLRGAFYDSLPGSIVIDARDEDKDNENKKGSEDRPVDAVGAVHFSQAAHLIN